MQNLNTICVFGSTNQETNLFIIFQRFSFEICLLKEQDKRLRCQNWDRIFDTNDPSY